MRKPRWSYSFLHPVTNQKVTVDSGKATKPEAYDDIRGYLLEHYGRSVAFIPMAALFDRTAPCKATGGAA